MINVVISGARGRMGTLICEQVDMTKDMTVSGRAEIDAPLSNVIEMADVIIDFTSPSASALHAELAAKHEKPIVIGTTGLNADQIVAIKTASKRTAVLYAPNMSLGVNVMFHLISSASKALGSDFKVSIEETHHTKKVDRPSGTGLKMLDVVLDSRADYKKEDVEVLEETHTTGEHDVSISSFRLGNVVGDHTITFKSEYELLEIKHSAKTRTLFARGAVVAARWIVDKPAGLYDMSDVLGLKI